MSRQLQFINRRQSQKSEARQNRPRRSAPELVMPKPRRQRRMHVSMSDMWSGMSALAGLRGNAMFLLLLGATLYALLCFIIFVL